MTEFNVQLPSSFSPRQLIEAAANKTGADFDFLLQTAARESSFDAGAQARTSSAAGLFQFIEQTWFAMMSRHGQTHGQGDLAAEIKQDGSGRFTVSDDAKREQILNLRFDPELASLMAGEFTAENADLLRERIGREPSSGELYAAHFLGASGAARLINLVRTSPDEPAAAVFPEAAAANKRVFEPGGQKLTLSQLLDSLTRERTTLNVPEEVVINTPSTSRPSSSMTLSPFVSASVSNPVQVLTPAIMELLASLDWPDDEKSSR